MEVNSPWLDIDVELFLHIVTSHLFSARDLCNMLATCKSWQRNFALNDIHFWQPLNRMNFGGKKKNPKESWQHFYLVCTPYCV